jgi:hypothetical protein
VVLHLNKIAQTQLRNEEDKLLAVLETYKDAAKML